MRVFSLAFLLSVVACGSEPDVQAVAASAPTTIGGSVADPAPGQTLLVSVSAIEMSSDEICRVDAEVSNGFIIRIDSPDAGWLDFPYCFVDTDLHGECRDEYGETWIFDGPIHSDDMDKRDDP